MRGDRRWLLAALVATAVLTGCGTTVPLSQQADGGSSGLQGGTTTGGSSGPVGPAGPGALPTSASGGTTTGAVSGGSAATTGTTGAGLQQPGPELPGNVANAQGVTAS